VTGIVVPLLLVVSSLLTQELETAAGAPFSLESALARGPVVMVFWSSWLPDATPSIAVIHEIERSVQEHGWSGAIVVFQDESPAAGAALGAPGSGLPKVFDRRGVLLRRFQVTRAPALLVIDRDGQVLSRTGLERDQVRAALRSLAERPPSSR
jgi:hypothetical protein